MSMRIGWWAIALCVAGCQAPQATPTPPVAVTPPAVAPVVPPPPATQSTDPRVAAAQRLAEAQVRAMNDPAASAAGSPAATPTSPHAVPVIEPGRVAMIPPAQPPAVSQQPVTPPPVQPPSATPALPSEDFKPVPPIQGVVSPPPDVVAQPAAPIRPSAAGSLPPGMPPADASTAQRQTDARAKSNPADLAAQLDAQLVRLATDQTVPSPDALAALEPEDRDILSNLLSGLSNLRSTLRRDPNTLPTNKVRVITDMADKLRSDADLSIANPALCTRIMGFGNYAPIEPLRLTSGVDHRPALYYEIENFSSRINDAMQYETKMRQDVAIYDAGGALVWQWLNEPVTDTCLRQRRDFFFARPVHQAINLPAGTYSFKISLTDNGRYTEKTLTLIMTPAAGAAGPATPAGPVGPAAPVIPGGLR